MSDEYGALTMVLLRLLAFPPAGGAAPRPAPAPRSETRAAPLRAPAPPALAVPMPVPAPAPAPVRLVVPVPLPAPAPAPIVAEPPAAAFTVSPPAAAFTVPPPLAPAELPSALGDRWYALVQQLSEQGALAALTRELAWQAGLVSVDETQSPPRWCLCVERETLRSPVLRDKLAAAIEGALGVPLALVLEPGVPADSPTRRDAVVRAQRQALAEETILTDPVVQALLGQFKTARIVPGSIKPA